MNYSLTKNHQVGRPDGFVPKRFASDNASIITARAHETESIFKGGLACLIIV